MKKLLLAFVPLLLCTLLSGQTMNFWTKKNDFGGLKRERAVAFSINGKGYAGTGVDTNETAKNDWWEYDPATDAWTQKASLPGSMRRNAVAFAIGNKGYVGTGMDSADATVGNILSDFWQYDPATNSWTQKANYPGNSGNGVYFATGFSLDGKGYICCGKTGPAVYSKEVWEYKPLTDSWAQRGDFAGGVRYQLVSFTLLGYAYVGLGTDMNIYRKDIWEYHPGSDAWIQKADFAGGERGSASTFTLGERGFVCLGADGGLKKDLWEYDPYLDTWTARASYDGSERKEAIAFAVNNHAYVGTGNGYSGKKAGMYEYTPVDVLGVEEAAAAETISVFPNPASDHISVTNGDAAVQHYRLLALDGREIFSCEASPSGITEIGRNDTAPGIYLLVACNEKQETLAVQRIIFN